MLIITVKTVGFLTIGLRLPCNFQGNLRPLFAFSVYLHMIPARGPQTVLHIHFRVLTHGVFCLGYSCSKTQCGKGGSREALVSVKGVGL